MSNEKPVCYCMGITEKDILGSLAVPGMTLEKFIETTKIGQKCTSCLLDFDLVLDKFGKPLDRDFNEYSNKPLLPKKLFGLKNPFLKQKIIRRDSGAFFCSGSFETHLTLANYGHSFEDFLPAKFEYVIHLIKDTGALIKTIRGEVEPSSVVHIAFNEFIKDLDGWFIVELIPQDDKFFGTLRPQILYKTQNCVFSVHTQPHSMSSKFKHRSKVVSMLPRSGEKVFVHAINAADTENLVSIEIQGVLSGFCSEQKIMLSPHASRNLPLVFKTGFQANEPVYIKVKSDEPTRKHLMTSSSSGLISFDHFPN